MAVITLADLIDRKRTVGVKFDGGGVLNVTYRPDQLTPRTLQRITEAVDGDDTLAFARMIVEVVSGWDLVGPYGDGDCEVAAGDPVPLDVEHLAYFPGPALGYIWSSIATDANPDPKAKRHSSGR